jgi:hypothetical protein
VKKKIEAKSSSEEDELSNSEESEDEEECMLVLSDITEKFSCNERGKSISEKFSFKIQEKF